VYAFIRAFDIDPSKAAAVVRRLALWPRPELRQDCPPRLDSRRHWKTRALDEAGKVLGERLGFGIGEVKLHKCNMGWQRRAASQRLIGIRRKEPLEWTSRCRI